MKYINAKLEAINTKMPLEVSLGHSTNNKPVNTLPGKLYVFFFSYNILDGLHKTGKKNKIVTFLITCTQFIV